MKGLRKWLGMLGCLLAICMLGGCAKQPVQQLQEDTALNVYATFYPIYAIAEMIVEDAPDLQLSCLVQPQDGCLRSYELSDWDLALLEGSADAVIAGGRGLESFETILYALGEEGPAVTAVLYNMDLRSNGPENPKEDSHWKGENPHIYMCTDGAVEIADRIAAAMRIYDPENSGIYVRNLEDVKNRLKSLLKEIQTTVYNIKGKQVALMNEALVYAAEEYGLEIACCVDRESGEGYYDQALGDCLETLKDSGARVVLIEKQAPAALYEAIEAAGFSVAKMDVLSTRSAGEGTEGYFDAMRSNAQAVSAAFEALKEE